MSRRGAGSSRALDVLAALLLCAAVVWAGAASAGAASSGGLGSPSDPVGAEAGGGKGGKGNPGGSLKTVVTGRRAELRDTVPVGTRAGDKTRSAVSLKLPRLRRGDLVRLNGEVAITLTCADQNSRCIGRNYQYSPNLRAQVVLAGDRDAVGASAKPVSRAVELTCSQDRPNRNHHCPLTIKGSSFKVKKLGKLPCKPDECRLNIALDAFHPDAGSNQFVVVGADQEGGGVEGGKARMSAAISHGKVAVAKRRTKREVSRVLPPSFEGGKRVTYSQRIDNLQPGDVLIVSAGQRTAIRDLPYFISTQLVVTTRRNATRPSAISRRAVSRSGLASETNGFNCTLGSSAFRSPCVSVKAGMATIEHVPRSGKGKVRPLYVNLVSRSFPKLAQARGSFAPARILDGGSLSVKRLRVEGKRKGGGKGGTGGGHKGDGGKGGK